MQCQLAFVPRDASLSRGDLEAFLEDRHWYRGDEDDLSYENQDTGVEFRLRTTAETDGDLAALEFAMDYVRPRFFALEAGGELQALVETFDMAVRTSSDDVPEQFTVEEFVEGWQRGNAAAIDEADHLPPFRLPREKSTDAWRWNRTRRDYQTVLGEGVFVPNIRLVVENGEVYRACAWPETIPYALPAAADLVLMAGLDDDVLARKSADLRVVDREALVELIEDHAEQFERRGDPIEHLLVGWTAPPDAVLEALGDLGDGADDRDLTTLSPGDVLDEESVD